ncbi:hypothetical protein ACFL27_13650 [candidate division CSSED10-310 bacterium]|uniref:Guanylate cyclase domain-containing protein n=1 Tax=candidate division CSSED10-310 bacterium TaxID=2855610 RepID=A0ABV6YYH2_UNCC1
MLNLIPSFIQEKFRNRDFHGTIEAGVLFLDISGFTPLTDTLMEHGKEGAEVVSTILNTTFQPIIRTVHQYGGFVSSFLGDAIYILFPDRRPASDLCVIAHEITGVFQSHPRKTRF